MCRLPSGSYSLNNPVQSALEVLAAGMGGHGLGKGPQMPARRCIAEARYRAAFAVLRGGIRPSGILIGGESDDAPTLSDTLSCTPFMHVNEKPVNRPFRSLTGTP